MSKLLYSIILGLLGAVIVHITVLFLVPHYAQYSAWSRLEAQGDPYVFAKLKPDDIIKKTIDPLFDVRACYFDLTNGPIRIGAKGEIPFWSLSIYNRAGLNIYSINNRTSPNRVLDLVIGDPIQMMDYKQTIAQKELNSVFTEQNIEEGFVVLRAFKPSDDWNSQTDAFLDSATCKQVDY